MGDDAIDEGKLVLCCALCCANFSTYPSADCLGCSGKIGCCCLNAEVCCKVGHTAIRIILICVVEELLCLPSIAARLVAILHSSHHLIH